MNFLTYYLDCASSVSLSHAYLDNIFTELELSMIESLCDNLDKEPGKIQSDKVSLNVRNSNIGWINLNSENKWLFDKFGRAMAQLNNDFFRLDLTGFVSMQYTEYQGPDAQYDWHIDLINDVKFEDHGLHRKLSASFILSESSEYEGGKFQYSNICNPVEIEQKRNRLIAFPSYLPHRITPIVAGKRRSIVIWVVGPKFK